MPLFSDTFPLKSLFTMCSLHAFFALAVSACVSALVFPVGETVCVAEYCAGNFPNVVQPLAPTPSVPFPPDSLTNAERLVRGTPLKAPVRRRSGAYPLFLYGKSVRLTVLPPDFLRHLMPSLVPVIQAVATVIKHGVIEVENSTGDSLSYISKNSLSKGRLQYESAIDNATTVTFPIQESSISASQVRITTEVAFSVSPVSGGC